jgi:uncharacterized protein YjbI with pentapeptide repeats
VWWSRDADDTVVQRIALLPSFGTPGDRKHVRKTNFVLKANSGAFTVPADWYELDKKFGMVTLRWEDANENEIDWDAYSDFTWSGTIVDTGNKTQVTNESLTFADADEEYSPLGPEGQVSGALLDGVVIDADNIGDLAITAQQIENATITAQQIANATITATQIADATITAQQIANATITAQQIANATITGAQIASATINGTNIAASAITGTHIQDAAITGAKIAGGTITASNIATGTITANEIQDLAITASKIANLTITAGQIANATITGAKIASATITGSLIATATITGSNIAGGTITGSNIAGGTITGGNIANSTITDSLIANATITGAKIASATITGSNIAAGTITASNIAAGTITADRMSVSQLSAIAADLGTITAGMITGATIRTSASGARTEMNGSNLFGLGFGGIGGTDGTTTQWYAKASDGKFYFAGGNGALDSSGLQFIYPASYDNARSVRFVDAVGGTAYGGLYYYKGSYPPYTYSAVKITASGSNINTAVLETSNNSVSVTAQQGGISGTDGSGVYVNGALLFRDNNGNSGTFDIGMTAGIPFPPRDVYIGRGLKLGVTTIDLATNIANPLDNAGFSIVRVSYSGGAFTIRGITTDADGSILVLVSYNNNNMTLAHQNTNATAGQRIITPTAADITCKTAILMRDATTNRWRVVSYA